MLMTSCEFVDTIGFDELYMYHYAVYRSYGVVGSVIKGVSSGRVFQTIQRGPQPLSSIDQSTAHSVNELVVWSRNINALFYEIDITTDSLSTTGITSYYPNAADSTFLLPGLNTQATYFWRVRAYYPDRYQGTPSYWLSFQTVVLGIKENGSGVPRRYTLNQNYPNPFNPTTQIGYTLAKASNVTVTVYDILGQQIATLVNGKNEPGEHSISWNALNSPSGVYFYRIIAGDFVQTKKMILMK